MHARWTWLYGFTERADYAPIGLDGVDPRYPVRAVPCGPLVAVVSDVPAEDFAGPEAEARLADLPQVAPLLIRHAERVDAIAHAVVPSGFATLFRSDAELRERTRPRAEALLDTLARVRGRREWAVKGWLDTRLALGREPDPRAMPAGQWLRTHHLRQRRERELRERAERAGAELAARLGRLAVEAVARGPSPQESDEASLLLWSWVLLVDEDQATEFRAAVDQGADGVRCVVSGPFPPYSFVGRVAIAGAA